MGHYFVLINNQQQGPFEEDAVILACHAGIYSGSTPVWCEGMEKWQPLETIPAFAKVMKPAAKPQRHRRSAIIAVGLASVVLLTALIWWLLPTSYNSDEDILRFLDEHMPQLEEIDMVLEKRDDWHSIFQAALADYNEARCDDVRSYIVSTLAAYGEKDALVYLFEKKKYRGCYPCDAAFGAATSGRVDVLKYIVKNRNIDLTYEAPLHGGFSSRAYVLSSLLTRAASFGRLNVCRYLVEDVGVKVENGVLDEMADMSLSDYKLHAKALSALTGTDISEEELMKDVADAARFLMNHGTKRTRYTLRKAKTSPNLKLRDALKGK